LATTSIFTITLHFSGGISPSFPFKQLQQFGKPNWHLFNFGKTKKMASNSLANQLSKNRNLAKLSSPHVYMRADRGCHRRLHVGGRVKKEIKNREGFLM
jgi:hypothetical protein